MPPLSIALVTASAARKLGEDLAPLAVALTARAPEADRFAAAILRRMRSWIR